MTKAIPAVILAGGKATRMGGGDKGLLTLGGQTLLARVAERISAQCTPVTLNANGDPARFDSFDLPVLADSLPDYPGPLAGVLAGLDWAADLGADAIVTVAADTPFFPKDLVSGLQAAAVPSGLAIAGSRDADGKLWRQPTFGIWPVALRNDLRNSLQDGLRKIVLWTSKHDAGLAEFATNNIDPFFNINTPADMAQAETMLGLT